MRSFDDKALCEVFDSTYQKCMKPISISLIKVAEKLRSIGDFELNIQVRHPRSIVIVLTISSLLISP